MRFTRKLLSKSLLQLLLLAAVHLPLKAQYNDSQIESLQLFSSYLQIPSVTGNENEAGRFFRDKCEAFGLHINTFTEQPGQINFAASVLPLTASKPNIIFLHHIDVVPAGDSSLWEQPPYSGNIHNGAIWGRGALDCKGLGVMQLMAVKAFRQSLSTDNLPYNVTLLCVSGEEKGGGNGAAILVKKYLNQLNPTVIFGEGGAGIKGKIDSDTSLTVFGISTAEKKSLWLKLTLHTDEYGHGATPPKAYVNKSMLIALSSLIRKKPKLLFNRANKMMFRKLGQLEKGLTGWGIRHAHTALLRPFVKKKLIEDPNLLALVSNTMVVSQLQNPQGPPNQIANELCATLDCRLLPDTDSQAFIEELKKELWSTSKEIDIEIIGQSLDAKATMPNAFYENFSTSLKKLYHHAETIPLLLPATTDNSYFRAKGIPVFGIMPAVLTEEMFSSIHGVNERLPIESFFKGIQVYQDFLQKTVIEDALSSETNQTDD